jgi:hypothetical protein
LALHVLLHVVDDPVNKFIIQAIIRATRGFWLKAPP